VVVEQHGSGISWWAGWLTSSAWRVWPKASRRRARKYGCERERTADACVGPVVSRGCSIAEGKFGAGNQRGLRQLFRRSGGGSPRTTGARGFRPRRRCARTRATEPSGSGSPERVEPRPLDSAKRCKRERVWFDARPTTRSSGRPPPSLRRRPTSSGGCGRRCWRMGPRCLRERDGNCPP